MLKLKLVKTKEAEEDAMREGHDGLNHGTKVLKELVFPWSMSWRIVCADSYFASVSSVRELRRMGMRFIGVVKTATKKFPMRPISQMEMNTRGDRRGLLHEDPDGIREMLAFVWMDRERTYFISTCSSLIARAPYDRKRWRQLEDVATNELPELVKLLVPQPEAAEIYYSCCASIDRHNRCRQDDLMSEKKIGTMDWSLRVNSSILGMIIVGWQVYRGCRGDRLNGTQAQYYASLAEELIENDYERVGSKTRKFPHSNDAFDGSGIPRSGIGAYLTPTNRLRKGSKHKMQGKCRMCFKNSSHVCSQCREDDPIARDTWICHAKIGATCFPQHMASCHGQ